MEGIKTETVSREEIVRQEEYMRQVKQEHTCWENTRCGKTPLAYVETYGCAQNESDSERLCGMLQKMGYGVAQSPQEADVIVFNTCCIRENAEQKVFGNLGALKHVKRRNPEAVLAVCGCMAQQPHVQERILKKYRHVDLLFGTHNLYRFPEYLLSVLENRKRVFAVEDSAGVIAEGLPVKRAGKYKALVPIMYGCNNFCSYCVVPYVRGRERSRTPEAVLTEVRELARSGVSEVLLLGQNVNSYGGGLPGDVSFAGLLRQVDQIEGIRRIRFMTSHPKDLSDGVIDAMANSAHICPQLHLPVQSGSDRVLAAMNRKYTAEQYLSIIDRVREAIPHITLSSDIIVGFPGETDEDFEETLALIERVRFDTLFTFLFSPRKGTPAAEMEDVLSDADKHKNFDRLLAVQNRISREKNEALIGTTCEVLVEGRSKTGGLLTGRTPGNKIVHFAGDDELLGQYRHVKITEAQTWALLGRQAE